MLTSATLLVAAVAVWWLSRPEGAANAELIRRSRGEPSRLPAPGGATGQERATPQSKRGDEGPGPSVQATAAQTSVSSGRTIDSHGESLGPARESFVDAVEGELADALRKCAEQLGPNHTRTTTPVVLDLIADEDALRVKTAYVDVDAGGDRWLARCYELAFEKKVFKLPDAGLDPGSSYLVAFPVRQ